MCYLLRTTGWRPASAAPTVRPQKPDSVMGLSMTLFSPNRSSRPFVTLYLSGNTSQHIYNASQPSHPREHFRFVRRPLYYSGSVQATPDRFSHGNKACLDRDHTHAPLYCATSSPSTNTLSLASSSSANASFRASLTATSLTPLGVAYCLLFVIAGNEARGWNTGLLEDTIGRFKQTRRDTGRRNRDLTMTKERVEEIE